MTRLKEYVLNIATSFLNTEFNHVSNQRDVDRITVLRNLQKINYFSIKIGYAKIVRSLIVETEHLCKNYEYYSLLIEVLRSKLFAYNFALGPKEHEKIDAEIRFYSQNLDKLWKGDRYYYMLILNDAFFFGKDAGKKRDFLDKAIRELRADQKVIRSNSNLYYLLMLELEQLEIRGQIPQAIEKCNDIYSLLIKHKYLKSDQRIAAIFANIAYFHMLNGELAIAESYSRKSLTLAKFPSNNFFIWNEILFYILFYREKAQQAIDVARMMYNKAPDSHGSFRKEKYHFFLVNALFLDGNIKQALKESLKIKVITKDKSGWDIALRVFRIMCMAELGELPLADRHIGDLRRQYYRVYKSDPIPERFRMIMNFLNEYMKADFSPKALSQEGRQLLKRLAEKKKPHSWAPRSPELVPFHLWVEGLSNQ